MQWLRFFYYFWGFFWVEIQTNFQIFEKKKTACLLFYFLLRSSLLQDCSVYGEDLSTFRTFYRLNLIFLKKASDISWPEMRRVCISQLGLSEASPLLTLQVALEKGQRDSANKCHADGSHLLILSCEKKRAVTLVIADCITNYIYSSPFFSVLREDRKLYPAFVK